MQDYFFFLFFYFSHKSQTVRRGGGATAGSPVPLFTPQHEDYPVLPLHGQLVSATTR